MSSWKEFLAGIFIGVLAYLLLLRVLLPSPLMAGAAILAVGLVVLVIIWKFKLKWVGTVDPGDLKRFLYGFIVGAGVIAVATPLQFLPIEATVAIGIVIAVVFAGGTLLRRWRAGRKQTHTEQNESFPQRRDRRFPRRYSKTESSDGRKRSQLFSIRDTELADQRQSRMRDPDK